MSIEPTTAPPLRLQDPDAGFELHGETTPARTLIRDTWRARPLIRMLARKNFYTRYRRASLGMIWAVGLPVIQATVLAVVFSRVVRIEVGVPYAAFLFVSMQPWSFFSTVMSSNSTAIVDGSFMSNRIYFPRAVLPISGVATGLYGFWISVLIALAVCLIFGVGLGPEVLLLVPASILLIVLTTAFALVNSAVHVYFRDVRYIIAAAMTAWFYVTPVLYPLDFAPKVLRVVILANPATGLVMLFRAATVGSEPGLTTAILVTLAWTVVLVFAAIRLHSRFDRVFVDRL